MKFFNLLILLLLLSSVETSFADCICKQPPKPELPSDRADAKEMEKAGKDVDQYNKEMKGYRGCILACLNKADNDLAGVISGWNYAVERFNAEKKQ
ncbi:hypothetical protein [Geotalea toluenoxydans]|uniref:hypothetical protein n=1 Tax=Geotalea toluenoxydans TaxID=421624 RepID=UPI0006D07B06|nr:hypothetical protein [Geotalea toluenoxydans]